MAGTLTATALGAALVAIGLGFDAPSLLVPGAALLGLTGLAVAWVRLAARGMRLVRAPGVDRIVEGEPLAISIERRGGLAPLPGGELTDPLLDERIPLGWRWRSLRRRVALEGRGRRELEPARVVIRDPLGLCAREVRSERPRDLLVLPRVEPLATPAGGGAMPGRSGADAGSAATGARTQGRAIELEIDGLRAYRHGSPASRIHWPAVARTGELIERRLATGSGSAPLIVLDAATPVGERELDMAVRAAASICVHLARRGGCAVLMPGDRRASEVEPDLRSWPSLHVRLALVEAGSSADAPVRAPAATLFWVTASQQPRLPGRLRVAGAQRYLVAPTLSSSAGTVAFEVAGCQAVRVGSASRRPRVKGRAA